ncbi:MAG: hypothetical protein ABI442_08395 [Gemmatimonadaceae bacterium]
MKGTKKKAATPSRVRGIVEQKFHSQMKVFIEDVALWRLIAADRALPHGWIEQAANARGVSASTVTMAIGGQTWAAMTDPPPVAAKERWSPRSLRRPRPTCPTCGRRKYGRFGCRDRFHTIDHRSTRYAKKTTSRS